MVLTNTIKQEEFYEAALAGKNVYLSGKAGTGKSYIVKKIIEALKATGKKIIAVAPTGVAANNIGGATIHSTFQIMPFGVCTFESIGEMRSEKRRLLKAVETIIIDEVSMLRPDILDAIHWSLIKAGIKGGLREKQVIFVGDLKQLPPILDDNERSVLYQQYDGEEFFQAGVYKNIEVLQIELTEVMRQSDPEFINNLNIIRDGGKSEYFKQFVHPETHGIILAPHNQTVKEYNTRGLAEQPGTELVFEATVKGNAKADEFNVEGILKLKHGCKIMYLSNSKNNPLVNGTLGTFINGNGKNFIKVDGVEYALELMNFTKNAYVYNEKEDKLKLEEIGSITQYPVKLAYALSIHKSQGLTFEKLTVDLSRPCFQKGQMYVALSRVKSPDGLRIFINRKA